MSSFTCPKCGAALTITAKAVEPKKAKSVEDVKILFSSELEELLSFEEKENAIILKPKRFLGSENFAKIAHIVRAAGGEYISAGKQSHFKIPTKKD